MVFFQTRNLKDRPPWNPICHSYWRATATIVQMLHWGCFRYVGLVRQIAYLFLKQLQEERDFRAADGFVGAWGVNKELCSEKMLKTFSKSNLLPDAINVRATHFNYYRLSLIIIIFAKQHTELQIITG